MPESDEIVSLQAAAAAKVRELRAGASSPRVSCRRLCPNCYVPTLRRFCCDFCGETWTRSARADPHSIPYKRDCNVNVIPKQSSNINTFNKTCIIYCGGLCPAHSGHIAAAHLALRHFGPESHCIFSPARQQYIDKKLKDDAVSSELRVELLNRLVSDIDDMSVSTWELGCSSFVPILEVLRHQARESPPGTRIVAVLGPDALGWPASLMDAGFEVAVPLNRQLDNKFTQAYLEAVQSAFPGKVHLLRQPNDEDYPGDSSTRIRAYCREHKTPPDNLPAKVSNFIVEHGLWGTGTPVDSATTTGSTRSSSRKSIRDMQKEARRRRYEARRHHGTGIDRFHSPCGYRLDECTSAFQKAVRRSQAFDACFWAGQLFMSGRGCQILERLIVVAAEDAALGYPLLILKCQEALADFDCAEREGRTEDAKKIFCRAVTVAALSPKSRSVNHAVMASYVGLEEVLLKGDVTLLKLRYNPESLFALMSKFLAKARDESSEAAEETVLVLCRMCYLERGALLKRLWRFLMETPLLSSVPDEAHALLQGLRELDVRANMGDQLFVFMAALIHTRQHHIDFRAQLPSAAQEYLEKVVNRALKTCYQPGKTGRLLSVPEYSLDRHTMRGRGATHRFHRCSEGTCIVDNGLVHVGKSTLPLWPDIAARLGIDESDLTERSKSHGPAMQYALNRQCSKTLFHTTLKQNAAEKYSQPSVCIASLAETAFPTLISQFFDEGTRVDGLPEVLPLVTGQAPSGEDPYRRRCREFYMRMEERFGSLKAKCQAIASIQKAQIRALELNDAEKRVLNREQRAALLNEAAAAAVGRTNRIDHDLASPLLPVTWPAQELQDDTITTSLSPTRVVELVDIFQLAADGNSKGRPLLDGTVAETIIGKGFSASILSAWLEGYGPVAIKWLKLEGKGAERKAREAQKEVKILTTLASCQSVVDLLGAGCCTQPSKAAFLVLEKANRDAWNKLVADWPERQREKRRQPTGEWLEIMISATEGLCAMHRLGYLHKDFNLQNVLLFEQHSTVDGGVPALSTSAKLSDFGCSIHEDDPPDSFAGHPRLSAPEVLVQVLTSSNPQTARFKAPHKRQPLAYSRSADVFMLGSALFEVCEGHPSAPTADEDNRLFHETSSQIECACWLIQCRRPSFTDSALVSPTISHLIDQCWAAEPSDRPTPELVLAVLCQELEQIQLGN